MLICIIGENCSGKSTLADAIKKERFKARMHGNLSAPVEQMLEKKHGMFDRGVYDYCFDGVDGNADALCEKLKKHC